MSDCFCGAGVKKRRDGNYTLVSHSPDCLWLCWCLMLAEDDTCALCGDPFVVHRGVNYKRQECRSCKTVGFEAWL